MKQKYVIEKNDEKNELLLKEYAELDKDLFSLMCEQRYDSRQMEALIAKGIDGMVSALRRTNFYPPGYFATKIAESIVELYSSDNNASIEVVLDEMDTLARQRAESEAEAEEEEVEEELEDEGEEIDELLEEDYDENYEGEDEIDSASFKIADDDSLDTDDTD
jgi:hypothetical protein